MWKKGWGDGMFLVVKTEEGDHEARVFESLLEAPEGNVVLPVHWFWLNEPALGLLTSRTGKSKICVVLSHLSVWFIAENIQPPRLKKSMARCSMKAVTIGKSKGKAPNWAGHGVCGWGLGS